MRIIRSLTFAEDLVPYRRLFSWSEMHAHLVVFLAEEENVRLEYEGYVVVEFKNGVEPSLEEASERTEFLNALYNHFIIVDPQLVERRQHLCIISEIELAFIFARLVVVLVYFLYYLLCDHGGVES